MSSEHEDAIQQISQPLMELFGDVHQPTECNCIAEAAEQVADWHLAQLQAAKAEARSKHIAEMQAYIVDPAIDDELGTVDYKVVAEKVFDYIENALTTPKEEKETL